MFLRSESYPFIDTNNGGSFIGTIKVYELLIELCVKNTKIFGIVSRDGGFTKKRGDNVILIPVEDKKLVTPISEALQSVIWHYLVSSKHLKQNKTKW